MDLPPLPLGSLLQVEEDEGRVRIGWARPGMEFRRKVRVVLWLGAVPVLIAAFMANALFSNRSSWSELFGSCGWLVRALTILSIGLTCLGFVLRVLRKLPSLAAAKGHPELTLVPGRLRFDPGDGLETSDIDQKQVRTLRPWKSPPGVLLYSAEPKPAKPTLLSRLLPMQEVPRNTLHLHPGTAEEAAWILEVLTRWNEGRL